jgi:hypothetical protein
VATVVHRALEALPSRQRTVLVMREMEGMAYADIAQVVGTNPRGVEATLRRGRARFRIEVSRAESAEVARATCRRVLRLVGDDPQASRSEEAAAHLAHCADCRRQARLGADGRPSFASRAFGFFPPLLGLGRLAALFRPSAVGPSIRRVSDRARDALALAGPGSSALAAPIVRMAEVAGGVLVATVVTMSPTLTTTAQPLGATVSTASEVAAPPQVQSVPATSLLFRASPGSPVTAGPATTAAQPSAPALTTPSLLGASPSGAGPLGVLSPLGLGQAGDAVASALSNVGSVSNILADQLNQVAQLTNSTLDNLTAPLGPGVQTLTTPVSELTNGVIAGLGNTVKGLTNGLRSGFRSPVTGFPVTSSAVTSPEATSSPVTGSALPAPTAAP